MKKNEPTQLFYDDIQACTRCYLFRKIMNKKRGKCPGAGYTDARNFIVGLSCGWFREKEIFGGTPFNLFSEEIDNYEGIAGKMTKRIILELIDLMEIPKRDIYVSNILKCSPPNDREPRDVEVAACFKWLQKEIAAVKPQRIICLGTKASSFFGLQPISSTRREHTAIISIYHPGYIMRSGRRDFYDRIKKEVGKYELE